MEKRILAVILTLCMLLSTMSFSVLADSEITFGEFLTAVENADYNYDGGGITVKLTTATGCKNSDACVVCDYPARTVDAPERIQGTNAQYQLFVGEDTDVVIKNVNFITDKTNGVGICHGATHGWNGQFLAGETFNVELQVEHLGSTTIEGCTFDGLNVSLYPSGDYTATVTGCEFSNVYSAYGIKQVSAANVIVKNNTFNNCAGGVYITGGSKGIVIDNNTFSDMGTNATPEKQHTSGLIQIAASVAPVAEATITISNNTSDGSTPVLRQLSANVDSILTIGNEFGSSDLYTEDVVTDNQITEVDPIAEINGSYYATIAAAVADANDGDVIEIAAGIYEEGVIRFPKVLKNVTIKGADNKTTILKNSSLQNEALPGTWSDPKYESEYHGVTIDGIVFDNSFIKFTGWANNALNQSVSYKDWTITNCEFKNVEGEAAVYFNLGESEQMENVTFTNNIIDGVLTTNKSGFGINAVKGNVNISGNTIKNVAFNSIQVQNAPAEATVSIKNNVLNSNNPLINVYNILAETEVNNNVLIAPTADSYYMSHISTAIDTSANFFGTGTSVDDAVFNENYADKLHTMGAGEAVTYTHYTDAAKTELVNLAVASVNGVEYLDIQKAIDDANPGDVIDLMDKTLDLPEGSSLNITKDLTIQNGTIDITDGVWNGNSIIEVHGGSDADFVELTMNDVDVVGENYSSAFGVVYAYDYGKVVLNNCNFELADEAAPAGGVLKGNGIAQSEFVVKDSTFMLENPNRVITNATVAIEGTTIDAKVTDSTLVVGTMNNHALRSVAGTITDSTITIDGFESGIKNDADAADLVIGDNSTVEFVNSVDADVNLSGNATIELKDSSKLIAVNYKDDASKDSVDDTDGVVVDKVAYLQEVPVAAVYVNNALSTASFTGGKITVAADVSSAEISGTWTFLDPTEVMTAIGTVQREAVFTPDDATYDTIEATVDVVVGYMPSRSPSSSTGGGSTTASYTVKFETNGGSNIESVKVEKNKTVKEPAAPEKENNIFIGWFKDKALTEEFDFDTKITKATTIYAGWVEKIPANQIILRIDSKAADVFGERKGMDVAPQIVNQRTMLPTRFVAESLGANVEWDEENQKVTITKGETVIEIFIGKDYAMVNGKEVDLDSPAFIENSRTYTPIRFISENLGAHVDWDGETKTVTITKVK